MNNKREMYQVFYFVHSWLYMELKENIYKFCLSYWSVAASGD